MHLHNNNWLGRLSVIGLVVVLLLTAVLPARAVRAQGVLTGSARAGYNVNVRSGPGIAYAVIGRLYGGQPVAFVGRNGDSQWLQLQAEGVAQWVNIGYVIVNGDVNALPITSSQAGNQPTLEGVIGNAFVINVRTGPGTAYASVGRLTQGDAVQIVARSANSEWVRLAGTDSRWIGAGFVTALNGFVGGLPVSDALPPSAYGIQTNITGAFVLNVRRGPGPGYAVVRRLTLGDQVTLEARNADGSWVKLQASGDPQWINAFYTTASGSGVILDLPVVAYTTNPSPGPVGSSGAVSNTRQVHTVQQGETLYSIAVRYGVNLYTLAANNGIADVNTIYPGQQLSIP